MSNSNASASQQSANQENVHETSATPNQIAEQQQRVQAVPSNRLPPVGIVMSDLSLETRPRLDHNEQVAQSPPAGIVMPDLSLRTRPRVDQNDQVAQTPQPPTEQQSSTAQRQAPTAQEIIAAVVLIQLSRSGQDGKK